MGKNTCFSLIAILLVNFFMFSCKEKKNENVKPGQVEFAFSAKTLKSSLKSMNSDTIIGLTWVVYTIEDASGNVIKNSEKIELYNMNGDYISKPISLVKGSYKLTRFMLLSWNNKILYASPVKGSPKAYLVQTPLPISFDVQNDEVTKLSPEVLSSIGSSPEDFGYATFGFEVANTFDFLIGVFIYNDLVKNYELTSAAITITSGTTPIITDGQLNAKQNDPLSLVSAYDSIGVTNKITLPSNYNNYTLVISKVGYKTFSQTFTKEELKQHFRSVDKGPLVVILDKLFLNVIPTIGLVGKYSFTGNANNEIGNYANGTVYGATLTNDRFGTANSAYQFTLASDHILVPNTNLFAKNEISISIWAKADIMTSNCMLMLSPDDWNDRCVICAQYRGDPTYIFWDYGNCSFNGRTQYNDVSFSSVWHHYVFMTSQSQNLKKIFKDGICLKSESFMGALSYYTRDIYIGAGIDWNGRNGI
jgi:hypothetical protein